jgi:hypothetical protein
MDEAKPPRKGVILQSRRETSSTGEKTKPSPYTEEEAKHALQWMRQTSTTRDDSAIQERKRTLHLHCREMIRNLRYTREEMKPETRRDETFANQKRK